jgi:polysaccharide export outer membrane protein
MKKILFSLAFASVCLFFGSCTSTKSVAYFQNIDTLDLSNTRGLYDAKIMPKDELTITVSASDPSAVSPFNLSVSNTLGSSGNLYTGGGYLQTYLVDNNGKIKFPVVGEIHVQGLTKNECEALITEKIKPYLSKDEKPIVTVRMASYRVTIIGEVGGARVVPVTTEKMSVVEALASAGDLTIYGQRDNILVIREDANGQKSAHRLNLNDASILSSPYYYLQQNDIIYVQPNKVKTVNASIGSSAQLWTPYLSIITALASIVVAAHTVSK